MLGMLKPDTLLFPPLVYYWIESALLLIGRFCIIDAVLEDDEDLKD